MTVPLTNSVDYIWSTELAGGIVIYPKIIMTVLVGTAMTMKICLESFYRMRSIDSFGTPAKWLENGHSHGSQIRRENEIIMEVPEEMP